MNRSQVARKPYACIAASLALTILATTSAQAAVTSQWDFNSGDLSATSGEPLSYFDGTGGATEQAVQFGTTTSFSIPDIQGVQGRVIRIPKNTAAMGLLMKPNLPSNGGGSLANQYSLVFDILFPAGSMGKARALLQIDDPVANLNEAEISVNTANGIGSGSFHGTLLPNTWHRIAVTVDLAAEQPIMTKYIDGVKVGSQTLSAGVDGRWAVNSRTAPFGSDSALLFSDSAGASEILFLNSLQVHDTVLAPNYVAALGHAQAEGIPATVTPSALVSDFQPADGAALVLPNTPIQARIVEGNAPINRDSIRLFFDGALKTAQITSPSSGELLVTFDPGLLAPSSTHQVELKYVEPSNGSEVSSGVRSFTLAPYNLPPIDLVTESLLYMPFELTSAIQGQAIPDMSAQSNDGVLTTELADADLVVDGRIGKAIDFREDTIDYVVLEKPWAGIPNTFAAWIKLPSTIPDGTRPGVIVGSYPAANNINWEVTTSGQARIYWNGGSPNWVVAGTDLRTDQWEHIAFVRDVSKTQIRFYLNGRLHSTLGTVSAEVNPTVSSYIGADPRGASTPHFRGAIDEVVIFNRPFSDEEVWRIYARAFEFPSFQFQTPQIVSVSPSDAATQVTRTAGIDVQIDEVNSSTKVDRNTVAFSINGAAQTTSVTETNGILFIHSQPATPFAAGTTYTNRLTFTVTPGGTTVEKTWTFTTAPVPVITSQPTDRNILVGSSTGFSVVAQVTVPVTYQWYHNGNAIPNATGSSLTIVSATEADAGSYYVVIRDAGGEVTSGTAELEIGPALPDDPAESLRYELSAHWPFDTDLKSKPAGYDGTAMNGAVIASDARLGGGSISLQQASQQWVRVDRPVIPDGALTYSVAGWFKVTGGSGRRFLWETTPQYAISTEITPAGTLKAFALQADSAGPNADTLIAPPLDEWHHAVVTFDSTAGVAAIYYDGQKVDVAFALNQGVGTMATTGFHIGTYRSANDRFYEGLIDDVAVWTRVLTPEEIEWLAAGNEVPAPLPSSPDPIEITVQPQDAVTLPHSTVFLNVGTSNGLALSYQWRRNGENIVGATATNLVIGDVTASADYTVVVSNDSQSVTSRVARVQLQDLPAAPADSLAHGLTAAWSFDTDFGSSSAAHNGTAMAGATITTEGKIGAGALRLSQASKQYVQVSTPVLRDGTMTYTVAGWFKVEGGTGRRFLWETSSSQYPISTEITPAGTLKAFTRQTNLNGPNQDTLIVVPQSEWHHVAVTFNSVLGKAYIYYDGVVVPSGFDLAPGFGTAPTTGFNIGTFRSANDRFFEGSLDDIGVWDRVLSEAEIQWLAAGHGILSSSASPFKISNVTVTAAGTTITWEGGTGPFKVQYTDAFSTSGATQWTDLGPASNETTAVDTISTGSRYYRVVGQ